MASCKSPCVLAAVLVPLLVARVVGRAAQSSSKRKAILRLPPTCECKDAECTNDMVVKEWQNPHPLQPQQLM
eukprot:5358682-Amphidinium_carterae.1